MIALWNAAKQYAWVAVFLAAMGFGAWVAHTAGKAQLQTAQNAAQRAEDVSKGLRTQLDAERLAGAARARHRALVAKQSKENHDQLETALGASPEWADEPVPAAVADSLRDLSLIHISEPTRPY